MPDPMFLGHGNQLVSQLETRHQWLAEVKADANDPVGLLFQWLHLRFIELSHLVAAVTRGRPVTVMMKAQWKAISAKFRTRAKRLTVTEIPERRTCGLHVLVLVKHFDIDMVFLLEPLRIWADEAKQVADERRATWQTKTRTSWNDWVAQELRSGASALHRFTKRDEVPLQGLLLLPSRGLSPLRFRTLLIMTSRYGPRSGAKYNEVAGTPWRQQEILGKRSSAAIYSQTISGGVLVPLLDALDVVVRTYIPDGLVGSLMICYKRLLVCLLTLKALGFGQNPFSTSSSLSSPKQMVEDGQSGFFPPLSDCGRSFAALWLPCGELLRQDPTTGRRKVGSPQAAVWKESLRSEAAAAKGLSSGAVLIDLVKAFEMVRLELVWYAGIRLGFPVAILRLILESFAFDRRLKCGGAYSNALRPGLLSSLVEAMPLTRCFLS